MRARGASTVEKRGLRKVRKSLLILAPCLLSLVSGQTPKAAPTTSMCPVLTCDVRNTKLDESTCFSLIGQGPITQISGQMCYDEETALPSDIPKVCPFRPNDPQYAWLDE
jgi:hypothetical protein